MTTYGWLQANKQIIATCWSFLSVQEIRHDVDMDPVASMCMWGPSGLYQSVHYAYIMY